MARKESVTIQDILENAFEMTREEGFASVTARKVAVRVGCSTQPIFRVYKNMEELWGEVYKKAVLFFQDYYDLFPKTGTVPFSNLGMAYIAFAKEEKNLFRLLFLSEFKEKKSMFMRMWLFIHGAACMSLTGDYDLSDAETRKLLEQEYANG